MNNWFKIIGSLAVIGILAALYVWFFVYNKPHRDYATATPDHMISAEALFREYTQDRAMADSLYTGKVLQISGNISDIELVDSLVIAVFVFRQGMFGDEGIRCIMLQDQYDIARSFAADDPISIKGYCTGYNDTDVIIEKASVVEK